MREGFRLRLNCEKVRLYERCKQDADSRDAADHAAVRRRPVPADAGWIGFVLGKKTQTMHDTMDDGREMNSTAELTENGEESLVEAIRYMQDVLRDIRDGSGWSREFLAGYEYALYHATDIYITLSDRFDCSCPVVPSPERRTDNGWVCGDCGDHLTDTDEVLP